MKKHYFLALMMAAGLQTATAQLCDPPIAPPATQDQSFCADLNPVVADLVATGDGQIAWFDLSQGFEPLDPSTPLFDGIYTTVQMIGGCFSDFVDIEVTLLPTPAPPTVEAWQQFQYFCGSGTVAELYITATGTVQWYLGTSDGFLIGPLAPDDAIADGISAYWASQTVDGCVSDWATLSVTVLPIPPAPVVSDQSFCSPGSYTVADLDQNVEVNGHNAVWWSQAPTGDFGTMFNPSTPLEEGVTYYAASNLSCGELSERTPIQVTFISVDNTVTIENGTLTANQDGAGYEWFFCIDGFTSMGVTSQTFSPTFDGGYAVVVNYEGCTATSSCEWTTVVVGIEDPQGSTFTAYPNPTSGIIHLSQPASGQVLDLSGRSLMSFSNVRSLDLSNLASGSYVVRTVDGGVMRVVRE